MVSQVSALVSRMQQIEPLETPAHLPAKILDATLGPRTQAPGWRKWFDWTAVIWQPRFGMGAATVAASFAVLFHAFAPVEKKITLADLNPVAARSHGQPAGASYVRARREVRQRPARRLRDRIAPRTAACANHAPVSEPETPQPSHPSPFNDPHEKVASSAAHRSPEALRRRLAGVRRSESTGPMAARRGVAHEMRRAS